jgi:hypothetical protein
MVDEENRIETVKRHKENLQRIDGEFSDLKGKLMTGIDNHRQFCEDIEKAREPIQKEIEAIESIPTSKIGEIEDDYWEGYQEIVEINNLSKYGKYGECKVLLLENTFRDTISYFATALKLRDCFFFRHRNYF